MEYAPQAIYLEKIVWANWTKTKRQNLEVEDNESKIGIERMIAIAEDPQQDPGGQERPRRVSRRTTQEKVMKC